MEAKNLLLKSGGNCRTFLDKAYNKHILNLINTLDEEEESRWETYNLIVSELIKNTNKDFMKEIKYRLTDGENPNEVILDIIDRESENVGGLVWFLRKRIEEYIDEDFFKRFL
jgi:hypothetical protein